MTLALSLLLAMATFFFLVFGSILGMPFNDDLGILCLLFAAAASFAGIWMLGGSSLLRPSKGTFAFALRNGWWVLACSCVLGIFDLVSCVLDGSFAFADGWVMRVGAVVVSCVLTGLYEESLFRGLVLGGLLDVFGETRRGMMRAILIGCLLFGIAHVPFWSMDLLNPLDLVQAMLKCVQVGLFAILLSAVTIRCHNFYGAAMLHGFSNLLVLLPTVGLMGSGLDTEYVASGEMAASLVMIYLVVIVLYLPLAVRGVRLLRDVSVPERGAFHDEG